jgi:hypothetical protein
MGVSMVTTLLHLIGLCMRRLGCVRRIVFGKCWWVGVYARVCDATQDVMQHKRCVSHTSHVYMVQQKTCMWFEAGACTRTPRGLFVQGNVRKVGWECMVIHRITDPI